jgi:hypothetical protein
MRLTLRTMLAFADDVLEPDDAREVGQKIEESEVATSLMHRLRDVTRRLRLGAPRVDAKGLAGDANNVAEYLDNTMPVEELSDFERICLESDVHLAEVASSHQILTLVLGEPAEVDPKSRQRMYVVVSDARAEKLEEEAVEPAPARTKRRKSKRASSRASVVRRRPEVPDYLREQVRRRSWRTWVAAAVLLIAVAGAAAIFGPTLVERLSTTTVADAGDAGAVDSKADNAQLGQAEKSDVPAPAESDLVGPDAPPAKLDNVPPAPTAGDLKQPDGQSSVATRADDAAKLPVAPAPSDVASADGTPAPATPADPMPAAPTGEEGPVPMPGTPTDPAAPVEGAPAPDVAVQPQPVGRLTTAEEVAVRYEPSPSGANSPAAWRRLSSQDALHAGDLILALPAYRPAITSGAGGGFAMQVLGGSLLAIEPMDEQGAIGIDLVQGRVVVMAASHEGARLRFTLGDHKGVAVLVGTDATLAVEVRRRLIDGGDFDQPPMVDVVAQIFVTGGEVRWQDPVAGTEDVIKAGGTRIVGTPPPVVEAVEPAALGVPPWVSTNEVDQLQKLAAPALNVKLTPGEPVSLRLKEMAYEARQLEQRSLATLSLTYLGDFETFLPLLSDTVQHDNWNTHIAAVRDVLARSPNASGALQQTLATQRDAAKARELYEMIRSYDAKQLRDWAAARLVANLEHPDLDFRILSFWNLNYLTGFSLNYRPHYTEARRQPGVRAWKQKLDAGLIAPRETN